MATLLPHFLFQVVGSAWAMFGWSVCVKRRLRERKPRQIPSREANRIQLWAIKSGKPFDYNTSSFRVKEYMSLTKQVLSIWPKRRPTLTAEQQGILEDWYAYWLTLLPKHFSLVTRFNHEYPLRTYRPGIRTLEIGAGTGEHLRCESPADQEYYALELRANLAEQIRRNFPQVRTIVGDCERRLDVPDASIDRVIAIHVLEHLGDLPAALDEIRRTLKSDGMFSVVIPCEGGAAYSLGRRVSSKRIFEKRYRRSYDWLISYEHINRADEIIAELRKRFRVSHRQFWPLGLPSIHANLVLGMTLQPL